jgi:hypothetical protein
METKSITYSRDYVGHPCIVALDREHCVVADGTGHLTVINLASEQVLARIFVGMQGGQACCNLRSLRVGRLGSRAVAVATRGGYAVLCDFDRQAVEKIHPVEGGSVHAMALAPDGRSLALGTGSYPLAGSPQPAHLEIWTLPADGTPRYRDFAALPGVCVDAIAWNDGGDRIVCATGLRSQKGGYVAQLDAGQLRPISFLEIAWAASGRVAYLDRDATDSHLAVISRAGLRVVDARDGTEAWRAAGPDLPDLLPDFDYDPENQGLVLTSGVVLDPRDGREKNHFLFMKDCTSIALRPGGGYLGASSRGRVYCWN